MQVEFEHPFGDNVLLIEADVSPVIPAQVFGPPEHCSPAEGGEVEILSCKLRDETGSLANFDPDGLMSRPFRRTAPVDLELDIIAAAHEAAADNSW
tara:strand:- start:2279 stop:2566 length:288 start_codon:yes stop_codon:yes gene_type:complete